MATGQAVGLVAPYYNLALAVIVIVLLFKLFSYSSSRFSYSKPWKVFLYGFSIFIIETIMTILRGLGYITFHPAIFPLFEMTIITLFIYMILLQKQYVQTGKKD